MTPPGRARPAIGFEGFGAAVGCAWVAGALSLVLEPLGALTGALAALALSGWLGRLRGAGVARHELLRHDRLLGLLVLAVAAAVYLDPPPWIAVARGVVLAAGLAPLWVVERRTSLHAPEVRPL